jgi:hypothetical protein
MGVEDWVINGGDIDVDTIINTVYAPNALSELRQTPDRHLPRDRSENRGHGRDHQRYRSMIFRLLLRGGALGAKFLLVLAITHYLGYEALGFYGVVVAASLIASKFYSVGFSSEINRLISVGGTSRRVVDKVLLLYLAVGLVLSVVTVLVYSLFQAVEATTALILCVTLVLLTEHLSFEINSFVFSAQKATAGALLFFVKTGLWAVLAVGGMMLGWVSGIASVLWLWVAANVIVIVAGYLIVVSVHKGRATGTLATATVWKAGLPFYLGTGLIALSQYAERFLIIDLEPYASLGKYVYAWSAANTLQALSYAVVAVVGNSGPRQAFSG